MLRISMIYNIKLKDEMECKKMLSKELKNEFKQSEKSFNYSDGTVQIQKQGNFEIPEKKVHKKNRNIDFWSENDLIIRKKSLTIGNKYWIEDINGNVLGFCKQKMLKLKEDIRIFSDETQKDELFKIKQKQIWDVEGNFVVVDSITGEELGFIKRSYFKSLFKHTWEIYDKNKNEIGMITEKSLWLNIARYLPYIGVLIPFKMILSLKEKQIGTINQRVKIIGDIWEMHCDEVPKDFDRRVLASCIILMGLIERVMK